MRPTCERSLVRSPLRHFSFLLVFPEMSVFRPALENCNSNFDVTRPTPSPACLRLWSTNYAVSTVSYRASARIQVDFGPPRAKIESLKVSIDYDSHLEQASVLGLSGTFLIIGEDFLLVPG